MLTLSKAESSSAFTGRSGRPLTGECRADCRGALTGECRADCRGALDMVLSYLKSSTLQIQTN